MVVGLIIAKGTSNRLPRKNIKQFCGKPLVAWSLIQLKYSQVDVTVVSTNDYAIADVAEQYGADVHWRKNPEESGKYVSGSIPLWFAMEYILETYKDLEIVFQRFPTTPLIRPGDIDRIINLCRETGKRVSLLVPKYETFINKIIDDRTSLPIIGSKSFGYGEGVGGTDAMPLKDVKRIVRTARPNIEVPSTLNDDDNIDYTLATPNLYVAGEGWQLLEIDYQSGFDLAEFYMKKYILKDGEDVYEKYWNERQRCEAEKAR